MKSQSFIFLIIGMLAFANCATEPEFERDNPYDIPLNPSDSVDASLSVLTGTNYSVSEYGLKLNLNRTIEGNVRIMRKNGNSGFELIYQEDKHPVGRDFFDEEIRTPDDVGYPLIYEIYYQAAGATTESKFVIDVAFGSVTLQSHFEDTGNYVATFDQSNVLLNDGIQLLAYANNDTLLITEVNNTVSELSVSSAGLLPSAEYVIVPFKMHKGEPTYLDDKSFNLKPAKPTNLTAEVQDTSTIKISWTDNSSFESKQRIIIDGVPKDLPPNINEFILTDQFKAFDSYSIVVESYNQTISKSSTTVNYAIPDFAYPRIDRIEHIDEFTFRIHFTERVSFGRDLTFKLLNQTKKVSNSSGFVEFTTNPEFIGYTVTFSARLSYGQYGSRSIEIRYRPTIDLLKSQNISAELTDSTLDVRTIGDLLIYADGPEVFRFDISDLDNSTQKIYTHTGDINLLSLSNNNQKAALVSDNTMHLLDLQTNASTQLPLDNSPVIYDLTFINDDADLLISSSIGLRIYSLSDNSVSAVPNFDTTNPLQFYGDASETRLVGLDRTDHKMYYFNTANGFSLHLFAETKGGGFVEDSSYVNNVDHYTARSNTIGFRTGEAYQFSINPHCLAANKCNEVDFETDHYDSNAFSNVIGPKHRFVVSDNFYRLIGQESGDDFQVIKKSTQTHPMLLKINRDNAVIIEFETLQNQLRFYDINWEWRFTNYGSLNRIVWPAN